MGKTVAKEISPERLTRDAKSKDMRKIQSSPSISSLERNGGVNE